MEMETSFLAPISSHSRCMYSCSLTECRNTKECSDFLDRRDPSGFLGCTDKVSWHFSRKID